LLAEVDQLCPSEADPLRPKEVEVAQRAVDPGFNQFRFS
jgi:hypothetical protein